MPAHIETITKGSNQRIRRTIGYRVVSVGEFGGNRREIARFEADPSCLKVALAAALEALENFKKRP